MLPGALVVLRSTASFCVAGQGSLAKLTSPRVVSLAIASLARLLSHPFLVDLALISSSLVAVVQFNNRTDKVCVVHGSLEVSLDGSSSRVNFGRK